MGGAPLGGWPIHRVLCDEWGAGLLGVPPSPMKPKAEALGYLEAKANAGVLRAARSG